MTDNQPVDPQTAPDSAPVQADPTPVAPEQPANTHPTGVDLPESEVQGPTGAVTDAPELEADPGVPEAAKPELPEQIEPDDVPNGGE